jgi:hypothetical protein
MPRRARLVLGIAIALAGLVLTFLPLEVAAVLNRAPKTSPEMINLRASWGGTLMGLGAFVAWLEAVKPWRRFGLGLLGWAMAGIGLARLIGFVLDGGPDTLQWVWLTAEIILAAGCAFGLRKLAASS